MGLIGACAVAVALLAAAVAVAPATARADADHDVDAYSLIISPATASGGSVTTFTAAFTNRSSPGSPLASANLTAPRGFKLSSASLPTGTHGEVVLRGDVVALRRLAVAPGATLRVTLVATPPDRCGRRTYRWRSVATEVPDFVGERLALRAAHSRLQTTVTTACTLRFATQPQDAVVGQPITGAAYDPSGPPVTVEVVDRQGHVVTASAVAVTIALGSNPGNATLGGTTTAHTVTGVASFAELTLNEPANGYTLIASSPGLTGATSDPFDESSAAAICQQNVGCQTSISTSESVFSVTANPDTSQPNAGTLTGSADVGTALQCQGYIAEDPNWFSFLMSSVNRSKVISYTIKQVPASAVRHTRICLGAPYEFTTRSGTPAPQGTLPDGESGFIGLLPRCHRRWYPYRNPPPQAGGPCVASRTRTPDGTAFEVTLTVDIPEGLAGDPWGRA